MDKLPTIAKEEKQMSFENMDNDKGQCSAEADASCKMLQDGFPPPVMSPENAPFIESESTLIANLLNNAGKYGNAGPDCVEPAARQLSAALKCLSGDDYNALLMEVQEKNVSYNGPGDRQFMGHLELDDWNQETKTWDKVELTARHYPMLPAIRIVQPGNTLWGMASDRLEELKSINYVSDYGSNEIRKMILETAQQNGIANPARITVGDAIILPQD